MAGNANYIYDSVVSRSGDRILIELRYALWK